MVSAEPTPRQREIEADLLLLGKERPTPDRELFWRLLERIRSELDSISASLRPGHRVLVTKTRLSSVHSCEGFLQASDQKGFEWTPSNVRGRVVHRALESLILTRYSRVPLDLAEAAIADLTAERDDYGPGEFLRNLLPGQVQDLLRDVNDVLVKFVADWPRVLAGWMPRVESPIKLAFGNVRLQAKVDLSLGIPAGASARTFLVDFKTGFEQPDHAQDNRFYALLETLRSKVPPYRVATYYLDSGTWRAEDVDEGVLDAATRRVVDGARRIASVESDGPSTYSPGPVCRFCPANTGCAAGREWLESSMTVEPAAGPLAGP